MSDTTTGSSTRWHALNVALLVLLWAFSLAAYGNLPEQIPGHIGLSSVTRWVPRSHGAWFMLPIMGSFSAGIMYVLSLLVNNGATGLNVPHRARVLALPRPGQRWVLEPVRTMMFAMAAWVLALMCWLQWMLYSAAQAGPDWRQGTAMLTGSLALTLLPFVAIIRIGRSISERIVAWESAHSTGSAG